MSLTKKLKDQGYEILEKEDHLEIKKSRSRTWILRIVFILAGLSFVFFPAGDWSFYVVGLFLIFFSFLGWKRKSLRNIHLFPIETNSFEGNKNQFLVNETRVVVKPYDVPSHTSPFEEGNRDYLLDLSMATRKNGEIQLFHFHSRVEAELTFGFEVAKFVESKLIDIARRPAN